MGVTEDGWFLGQYILKPGESKQGNIRVSVTADGPVKLNRVAVVPDYVEFEGGQASGVNAAVIGASLKQSRDIKVGLLQNYRAKLKSAEAPSSVASLIKSDQKTAVGGNRSVQLGMNELSTFVNLYGADALSKVCSQPLPLRAY